MRIIDFHTHVFPDDIAERAVPLLAEQANVAPHLDGTMSSLLRSMDDAGVDLSVVASIATKPSQFAPILDWSKKIASDRLEPFPSIHPDDADVQERVRIIRGEGFKGIKLHPYYQDFDLDDDSAFPLYEALEESGLVVLCHTGFDIGFPMNMRKAEPTRILRVIKKFPDLQLVTTHFGAWHDWDEMREHMLGKPIYMEISFSLEHLGEKAREMMRAHHADYILFGTDSPWTGQKQSIEAVRALNLGEEHEHKIFHANAERLLGMF